MQDRIHSQDRFSNFIVNQGKGNTALPKYSQLRLQLSINENIFHNSKKSLVKGLN